jgi:hypothetical protein
MTHFEDLTEHTYSRNDIDEPEPVNVGWLGRGKAYLRGHTPDGFISKLEYLCETQAINHYKGSHCCDICPDGAGLERRPMQGPGMFLKAEVHGNGEIRVLGKTGKTFVAPVLIVHYVRQHGYMPPKAFVEAVMASG